MINIRFGTDGWRAIIAQEYTTDNLLRVTDATADYMLEAGMKKAVIGHDCRFGGELFSSLAARQLATRGIEVYRDPNYASTPMVSYAVNKLKADMGIVITASHNPPSYNGFKLKSSYGGPTIPAEIKKVEGYIKDRVPDTPDDYDSLERAGKIYSVDLEQMYYDHVVSSFDIDLIRSSGIGLAYDAMYGAGQRVVRRLFPDAECLHCEENPSFMGQAPEPIARNLTELSELLASRSDLHVGLANDGDADRIGMYDAEGRFVDSHHLLLLLLYYLYEYKGLRGKVITTFSVSDKVNKLADIFGLETEVTPIGFKHIAEIMTREDVLLGGEESGGLAVKGHIPERDGIWNGLLILEFMAATGKSLRTLIDEIYERVGSFDFDRDDLHLSVELKEAIIEQCRTAPYQRFGNYAVQKLETTDGFKFRLSEDEWVLIRPSGTEPLLRVYAQAPDAAGVRSILDATREQIL